MIRGAHKVEIDEVVTYDDMCDYLLVREPEGDNISKLNPAFTKKDLWDFHMTQCLKNPGKDLSTNTKEKFLKIIKKDFP